MNNLVFVALAILLPFVFKTLQLLKDQKQQLKEMDERYEQSKRYMNYKRSTSKKNELNKAEVEQTKTPAEKQMNLVND